MARIISATSPHRNYYEGDLVPRYEDPGGHAVGIKTPGGVVLRTDIEGKEVQLFAGGLRNVYDLILNRDGEIFAHDSDMETDDGTPWFRPTQLFHVKRTAAELGWRRADGRGFPEYFIDNLPRRSWTGRGGVYSPPVECSSTIITCFPRVIMTRCFSPTGPRDVFWR